jgi:hypothetical protein
MAGPYELAGGPGDVREVNRGLAGSPAVEDFMTEILQDSADELFQGKARVVVAECDFHGSP